MQDKKRQIGDIGIPPKLSMSPFMIYIREE